MMVIEEMLIESRVDFLSAATEHASNPALAMPEGVNYLFNVLSAYRQRNAILESADIHDPCGLLPNELDWCRRAIDAKTTIGELVAAAVCDWPGSMEELRVIAGHDPQLNALIRRLCSAI